ncbi:abasic site processing protein HMCES isoform X2 [Nymphalis io]|uniref:abasic site processing protein HMCES isoform X2 n=1 Tax=Inachis io TaxID=171585 RepID=UPI0021691803|nr:abasic site processing protein HMCES isoform X2 [Nymphalis io]
MCGRTGLSLNKEQVRCACSYKQKNGNTYIKPDWLHEHNDGKEYLPSYNIAPSDVTPVLIAGNRNEGISKTSRVLKPMMWGIIPPWHKGDYKNHNLSTNNCRIENIKSSKLFNPILINGGRCVIVVEGFYEWQTTIKFKIKQPYYIYAPQGDNIQVDDPETWNNEFNETDGWKGIKLLHMAGLYHAWQHEGTIVYSYSVITMESNDTLNWLHHRMPAILDSQEQIDAWLDIHSVNSELALSYLRSVKILSWHQVSKEVNNSRYKSSNCNKRVTTEKKSKQKTLTSFFTKTEKRKYNDEDNIINEECKKIKS